MESRMFFFVAQVTLIQVGQSIDCGPTFIYCTSIVYHITWIFQVCKMCAKIHPEKISQKVRKFSYLEDPGIESCRACFFWSCKRDAEVCAIHYSYMDVSKNRGTLKWMVKILENLLKWMIWGYHYFWKQDLTVRLVKTLFSFCRLQDLNTLRKGGTEVPLGCKFPVNEADGLPLMTEI